MNAHAWISRNGSPRRSAKAKATVTEVENGSPSPSVIGARASGRASDWLAAARERAASSAARWSAGAREEACASRVNALALRASAWGSSPWAPSAA